MNLHVLTHVHKYQHPASNSSMIEDPNENHPKVMGLPLYIL